MSLHTSISNFLLITFAKHDVNIHVCSVVLRIGQLFFAIVTFNKRVCDRHANTIRFILTLLNQWLIENTVTEWLTR